MGNVILNVQPFILVYDLNTFVNVFMKVVYPVQLHSIITKIDVTMYVQQEVMVLIAYV
jgi:hypothetical protein